MGRCAVRVAAATLAAAALAGCAAGPRVSTPEVRLPAAFEAPQAAAGDLAALDRWWTLYDDPALTGLVEQALAQGFDARTAAARVQEARAIRRGALVAYDPQGNLQASASATDTQILDQNAPALVIPGLPAGGAGGLGFTTEGLSKAYGANFNVTWELDVFGRRRTARRAADAALAAALLQAEAARTQLAAEVADQLFQARGLAIQLADAEETARLSGRTADLSARRVAAGLSPRSEADRAAAERAQSVGQAEALRGQLTAARRALLVLLGRGADAEANLPTPAAAGSPPQPPALTPGALLARRPDVRAAEAQLAEALGRRDLDRLALFPTFSLAPGLGLTRSEQPGYDVTLSSWTLGANLLVPVLDRRRLLSQLDASGARAEQAVIAYERAVQTAYAEAESALTQLAAERRQTEVLVEGERRARLAYEAGLRGYELGLTDLQRALDAERSWRATRSQLTAVQVTALRRSVQLFKALGGGWTPGLAALPPFTSPPGAAVAASPR